MFSGGTVPPQDRVRGDVDLFRRTISFDSYAPHIRCPVMHRSATNDFPGWMDDVYRTNALIPDQPLRDWWTPHFNHRLSPEVAVAMPLWLDHFLKGGPALPGSPQAELALKTDDGLPRLTVRPDVRWPAERCEIHSSIDPDPRARFWRSADVSREGDDRARIHRPTVVRLCQRLPRAARARVAEGPPRQQRPRGAGSA